MGEFVIPPRDAYLLSLVGIMFTAMTQFVRPTILSVALDVGTYLGTPFYRYIHLVLWRV